jgi:two-component system LytT family response regulator
MTIKSLLIDDEYLAIAELKHMLEKHPEIEVADTAQDWQTALEKIRQHKPDLIFLDISMPEKNGFELLSMLDDTPQVIFVTAFDQFAIKAFEVNALDYLLKPVNANRLEEAIKKVKKNLEQSSQKPEVLPIHKRIFIKDGEHCFFVALTDIILLESAGNYVKVFFGNKKPMLHRSLN